MKRLFLSIALTLGVISAWGQEIKTQQVVADDYFRLFEEMGYKVYSFDISEFEDVRSYQPIIKHYKRGLYSPVLCLYICPCYQRCPYYPALSEWWA